MEDLSRIARSCSRLAPKRSATAAVFQKENRLAYGVLTNVSSHGACIITDSFLPAGANVELKLSFYDRPEIFEAESRVVWNRRGNEMVNSPNNFLLHGLEFVEVPDPQRAYLSGLLGSPDFKTVSTSSGTQFDHLKRDLQEALDLLGDRLMKSVGQEQ